MHQGRVVLHGAPQTLVDSAAFTRIVITGGRFTKELLGLVQSRRDVAQAQVEQNRLIVDVATEKTCAAIINLLVESGADVSSVTRCSDGLEATYRAIVEKSYAAEPVVR